MLTVATKSNESDNIDLLKMVTNCDETLPHKKQINGNVITRAIFFFFCPKKIYLTLF